MSLTVETGTGSATSDSYMSVADADIYHAARGKAAWALLATADKEQALRKATDYMTQKYRRRWVGVRFGTVQALDWPRSLAKIYDVPIETYYATNIVPQEVKNACAALALRASTADLLKDLTQAKASVTIGPISTTYAAGSARNTEYPEADLILRPLLRDGGSQIRLVRV